MLLSYKIRIDITRLFYILLILLAFVNIALAETAEDSLTNLKIEEGIIPLYKDKNSSRILVDIAGWHEPLLLGSTLEHAVGTSDINGLDRAQNTNLRLVKFRRIGKRVFLVELNTKYVANSIDLDEIQAVRESFPESILWSGEILPNKQMPDALLIDLSSLSTHNFHGVNDLIEANKQGKYTLDLNRSSVISEECINFPDNLQLSAFLTYAGTAEGVSIEKIAMDSNSLSIKQRVNLIRLPKPGYNPRNYHPASGGFSISRYDFAQPTTHSLEQHLQMRFRLQKTDPQATRSTVVKPIVFYLDRGTPEPIRSALLEGANWWQAAFDAAGFINAFHAELAPPSMNMSDIRYNTITWTHRSARGWSYGHALADPRTGEIIKGAVNLDSQRARHDLMIAEGLLNPYHKDANLALKEEALQMALNRLKQLAAHEIGHALGFAHNFAASRKTNGSVLDYPHPQLRISEQGVIRLDRPYDHGIGEWDKFLVAHAYLEFPIDKEKEALSQLRLSIHKRGYGFVSDNDARLPGDAHPEGITWDLPGIDPIRNLEYLMRARRIALSKFADGAVPPDRQAGEVERRLVPIYLLHRYQTEAVARLLGGVEYRYGLQGENDIATRVVPENQQHSALESLAKLLKTEVLEIPGAIHSLLLPPASNEYQRSSEYIDSYMLPIFDPIEAARVATTIVAQLVMNPNRLNRLYWQHGNSAKQPSLQQVMTYFLTKPWAEIGVSPVQQQIIDARNWVLLDAALLTLNEGKLHTSSSSELRNELENLAKQLVSVGSVQSRHAADWIQRYFNEPHNVKLRNLPRVPPGAPI